MATKPYHKIPWLGLVNGALGASVFTLALHGTDAGVIGATGLGIASWGGFMLAFGRDQSLVEAFPPVRGYGSPEAAQAMAAGRNAIRRLTQLCGDMPESSQVPLLEGFVQEADKVMRQLEADPRRLPGVRRFLDTYLDGIMLATEKYAELRRSGTNQDSNREQFTALLTDAKQVATKQEQALVADDEANLDLDITVLRRRMALELK